MKQITTRKTCQATYIATIICKMRELERPKWKQKKELKRRFWIILLIAFLLIPLFAVGMLFASKNISFEEPLIVDGATISVKAGGDFQAALDRAKPGDTILLQAGATFKGAFKLPNKNGNEFITIRTSAPDTQLPPPNTRLDPKKYAAVLPKIISNIKGEPAILAINGAHHYRFIGVEFGPTIGGLYNIIQLGTTEENKIEDLPHHIEFDRIYLHGSPTEGQRRGIAANGRFLKIMNSHLSDLKRVGEESQAIGIWATDGNIEIVNNYLEAAAENILFGGAGNKLSLVASDVLVRDNWMNKPLEWRNENWGVKNFLEIKSGKRIKIENNLFTNNWAQAQEGTAILFRAAEDSGKQAVVEDIVFINNLVRGSGSAINIFGGEGKGGRNLTIRNNIFEDISAAKYGGRGFFVMSTTFDKVVIENNTVFHDGSITIGYGEPVKGLVFRNNIVSHNLYGFMGDGVGPGKIALSTFYPQAIVTNNIIIGSNPSVYGQSNFYPTSMAQIGFVNPDKSDYRLQPTSQFLTKGVDGKQIGANLNTQNVGGK